MLKLTSISTLQNLQALEISGEKMLVHTILSFRHASTTIKNLDKVLAFLFAQLTPRVISVANFPKIGQISHGSQM